MLDTNSVLIAIATLLVTRYTIIRLFREKRIGNHRDAHLLQAPQLRSLPIVGSLPFLPTNLYLLPDFFMNLSDRLGPIFFFYAGRQLAVVINGKEAILEATVKHSEAFSDRADIWAEKNILNLDQRGLSFSRYHDLYKKNRKATMTIMKEFGFGDVRTMNKLILEEVQEMIDTIVTHNGDAFEPESLFVSSTSNVVMRVLFGKEFRLSGNDQSVIINASNRFLNNICLPVDVAPIVRFYPRFSKMIGNMVQAQGELMKSLKAAIDFNRMQTSENTFVKRFIEIMGSDYDQRDLLYILRDLSMGSSTTIATSIMWSLGELANHPEVLKRLHEEIDEAIPDNRFPELEDKPRLPYLEATVLEVWRRHNLTPTLPQSTLKDTEACGYFIPKDCMVVLNMQSIHMNPKLWTNPDEFRPERFLDENNMVIGRDSIFPFGMGKRSCPGEAIGRPEFFLCLASLVMCFDVLPPVDCSSIDMVEHVALIVSPKSFKIRLIPRRQIPTY